MPANEFNITMMRSLKTRLLSTLILSIASVFVILLIDFRLFADDSRLQTMFLFAGTIIVLTVVWFLSLRPLEKRIRRHVRYLERETIDLAYQKERFDLALSGTSTGVWDWDIQSGLFYWNTVLLEILGLKGQSTDNITVEFFQSLIHPDDKIDFNNSIIKHLKNKSQFEKELRLHHSEGHWLWVRLRGRAWLDEEGKAYRMLGSLENITELKKISIQTNNFIQGIDAARIAFAIIDLNDPKRRFSYASPAFCDLTLFDMEKILTSNLNMFSGPETAMNSLDNIDYAFIESKKLTIKMYNYKLDGTAFWNEVILRPIFGNNKNKAESYIVIFNDLTETLLREKQEVSRQRAESLGALAGSVAHEINNLLMPMSMAKDILEDALRDDCDPFAREQLNVMADYAAQAKTIVEGILTFSRKETKNIENANLYEELQNAVNFIHSLLSSKITLTLLPPDEECTRIKALINTTELKQIITNLCKNAEDACDESGGKITISIARRKPDHAEKLKLEVVASDFAVISVKDNGGGIAKENVEKIFDPLFTTKPVGQGTGLGLSVVVGILRSWGGSIKVKSVLGQGTEFEIYIPIQKMLEDFNDLADLSEGIDNVDIGAILNS